MQLVAERAHARRPFVQDICHAVGLGRAGTLFASLRLFIDMERDMNEKNQGEGNREADRRYRQGVRETVRQTTEDERAERARELTPEEREEAERAEREGRERKRSNSSEREI